MTAKPIRFTDDDHAVIFKLASEGATPMVIAKHFNGRWHKDAIANARSYRDARFVYVRDPKIEPAPVERPSIVEYEGLRIKRIETFVTTYSPLGISTGRQRISLSGGLA